MTTEGRNGSRGGQHAIAHASGRGQLSPTPLKVEEQVGSSRCGRPRPSWNALLQSVCRML